MEWGGDAPTYVLLAQNLLDGRGFTYAGQPTGLRTPGYPLLLAGLMWVIGTKVILAVRCVQFVVGLATAYICARSSALIFSANAARPAFAIALVFPTLVFISGEVLTEAIGAFLAALFFYIVVCAIEKPRKISFVLLGAVRFGMLEGEKGGTSASAVVESRLRA